MNSDLPLKTTESIGQFVFVSVHDFWHQAQEFLFAEESRFVKIIDFITLIRNQDSPPKDLFLWLQIAQQKCIGFLIFTPNGNAYCSEITADQILNALRLIKETPIPLKSIQCLTSNRMLWEKHKPSSFQLYMHNGLFECKNVLLPDSQGGRLIRAQLEHQEIIRTLARGFIQDCFPDRTDIEGNIEHALKKIDQGRLYLWQNQEGRWVSMAAQVRQTPNTASISWVYTLPSERGQGYGSKVTAYLSQHLLDQGFKACNLFTNLNNPTSNSIYQKIGYLKVGEQLIYQ